MTSPHLTIDTGGTQILPTAARAEQRAGFAPWTIVHLDLSEEPPTLLPDPQAQGYYIVFWWHGVPLGHREIPNTLLPMPAPQLKELALDVITPAVGAHLREHSLDVPDDALLNVRMLMRDPSLAWRWKQCSAPTTDADGLTVSVVVCTRDRPASLARCLDSLQRVSSPPHEILVVDNAPCSDDTHQLVARRPGIRYVVEPRPGLDAARNTGIRHAAGDLIAFTDDDVTVHPAWIARLRQAFTDPQVMAVTGLVLPAELDTEAQTRFERYWSFNRGYRPRTFDARFFERKYRDGVPVWDIGAGANMAFRREVFEHTGGFDERLDAGAAGCSGDSECWYRILAEGGQCRYDPKAVVFHYHRRDDDGLNRQMYYYLRGHAAAQLVQFEKYRHWESLRRLLLTLPRHYARLFIEGLLNGFEARHRTVFAEITGYLSGMFFYLRHKRTGATPQQEHVL